MDARSPLFTRRRVLQLGAATASLPVLGPALAACGNSAAGDGSVKLSGWDYEPALVQQNVDRFEEMNKDIKVAYTPIAGSQYVQKTIAEFTGGGGPDVLYCYDESLSGWVASQYLQPIDGLPGVDAVYADLYQANADAMSLDGKRYGLPYYTDTSCLIYNAAILNKAGINTPPTSLDELEQQCLRIRDAGLLPNPIGLSALLSDAAWTWVWSLVFASGGDMFAKDGAPTMDGQDPTARNILTWLQRACTVTKIIDPAAPQLTPDQLDNALKAGQYAFVFSSRYGLRDFNDPKTSKSAGNFKLGYVPSLDGKTQGALSTTRMYCLAKDTQVKDKAVKLLNYLGGFDSSGVPVIAKFWTEQRGLGFAFRSLEKDEAVQKALTEFADRDIYAGLSAVARPATVLKHPWYPEFETEQQKIIQQVMTGQSDPAAAVRTMSSTAKTLIQKYS